MIKENVMLQVGAGVADITPKAGAHMLSSGIGTLRKAQVVLDPLTTRAVVFEVDERKVCLLSLDVTLHSEEWTERIRAGAQQFGFAPEQVMVFSTQTHSAPCIGEIFVDPDFPGFTGELAYVRGSERDYCEYAVKQAIRAIGEADASRQPVQLGVGTTVREDLAFNRRGVMRDGKVCMPWYYSGMTQPLGPTHVRYYEGPIDPEVGVLCARDGQMNFPAMILHYTCHPVNIFATRNTAISADWPGAWGTAMQQAFGASCKPLVMNGCCGNIHPWPAFTPNFQPDHQRMGRELGQSAQTVIQLMEFTDVDVLDWRVKRVPLPLKDAHPEQLAFAQDTLARHPEPVWKEPGVLDDDWFRAASIMSVEYHRKRSQYLHYEIQTFRVGDVALVSWPGEPFVEGQLALKIASPAAQTFVTHCATQYVGYIPVAHAFPRGGHEVNISYWAKLAPEALDTIVTETTEMLNALFGKDATTGDAHV